jgi:hypothetical protein
MKPRVQPGGWAWATRLPCIACGALLRRPSGAKYQSYRLGFGSSFGYPYPFSLAARATVSIAMAARAAP